MADSTMGTSLSLPSGGIVFMLSGQGSQKPGMGADLLGVPEVAAAFECAARKVRETSDETAALASPEGPGEGAFAAAGMDSLPLHF